MYSSYLPGVTLANEESVDITEQSNMSRNLCIQIVGFGEGLERDVDITLGFAPYGFISGTKLMFVGTTGSMHADFFLCRCL